MVVGRLVTETDVVVLGAGPGGYVAAIRAAQLGKDVTIIDPNAPGGTCLHAGCIPSKALLAAADRAWQTQHTNGMGITVSDISIDLSQMQHWKTGIVQRLSKGIEKLLKGNDIKIVRGRGWFTDTDQVRVEEEHFAEQFSFKHCILAVGADAAPLPGLPFDGERVLTATQALNLDRLPDNLAIIGADYIAAELATLYAKLGVPVRLLLPAGQQLLCEFDPLAGRQVQSQLRKLGVKIERDVTDPATATADAALVAISAGLTPRTTDLDLDKAGVVAGEHGFIPVNDCLQTSTATIYAVGDVTGGPPLATLAIKQGKVAAEHLAGLAVQYAPQAVPRVAWTTPEVAAVGLTAAEAQAAGYQIISGRFPLGANGRALTLNAAAGVMLTVAEQDSQALLGVTIIAPHASDLIGEAALALEMGATLTDLAETLHPHPSLGEALQESAEAALRKAVHILM